MGLTIRVNLPIYACLDDNMEVCSEAEVAKVPPRRAAMVWGIRPEGFGTEGTVIHVGGENQKEPRLEFLTEAVKVFEYPTKCITHEKCPGLGYTGGVKVTITNGTPVPYELQEVIGAMCEELFGQKAKVRGVGGPVEDPMYLEAKETQGYTLGNYRHWRPYEGE